MKQIPEATSDQVQIISNGKLTFYLSEKRIGLDTGFQFFSIQGANQYCTKQVGIIRCQIINGTIKTVSDFYSHADNKVILKSSQKSWFFDAVERLDPKPPVIAVEDTAMAILLEPEATTATPLLTTLMAVEI